jgi:hypothetical protein
MQPFDAAQGVSLSNGWIATQASRTLRASRDDKPEEKIVFERLWIPVGLAMKRTYSIRECGEEWRTCATRGALAACLWWI